MAGPLKDVKVLVLAGMGPVPFLSMLLADAGADVLRVTRPTNRSARELAQTKGLSEDDDIVNRGTKSVEIDLKSPEGRSSILRLAAGAEVFIEGYRPGAVERLGLGPKDLLSAQPSLVYARVTGYGQTGSRALQAGHDINYVAQSGALHAMARHGEAPRPPLNILGDYAAGGALGAFGIVSALLHSSRTGQGQVLDIAMADGVALFTAKIQSLRAAGLYSDIPGTNFLDSGAPFYDTYRCADGKYIAVGAIEPDFYREFISRLETDTSAWPQPSDQTRWKELRMLIAKSIETKSSREWDTIFAGTDACVSPVLSFDEAMVDEHNVQRELYRQKGDFVHPSPAPRFGRSVPADVLEAGTSRITAEQAVRAWESGNIHT